VKHLNQPATACLAYHEEVQRMNQTLAASTHDSPPSIVDDLHLPMHEVIQDPDPESELLMDIDTHTHTAQSNPTPDSPFIEMYPGAAQTFGRGKTFMDLFDADSHAEKRRQHPYYPFASKAEWGLASFLLRSNLSMDSIDKFLKLELVSSLYV
jgi:hypothetical protein